MRSDLAGLVASVTKLEGVTAGPHRFGGTEFTLGKVEIGHVHRWGQVDIPFTLPIRAQLLAEGKAEHHHILPESGWITFHMRSSDDEEQALWLMRLSYLHKRLRRGRRSSTQTTKLTRLKESLNLSDEVEALIG